MQHLKRHKKMDRRHNACPSQVKAHFTSIERETAASSEREREGREWPCLLSPACHEG